MDLDSYEGEDFHPLVEPMVIIDSQDDEEENANFRSDDSGESHDPLDTNDSSKDSSLSFQKSRSVGETLLKNISSEVTIFPVKKKPKPAFKIRLFGKAYTNGDSGEHGDSLGEDDDDNVVRGGVRNPGNRAPVRLISKEEALNAEDTYAKRKSSPLEKCHICKKYFRRMKSHLLKHEILQNQEGANGLICEICSKAFNNHSNLLIHMRTHTGDKPYVCEVCHKSFSQSCNLVNHMRIHTGEKPFKCPHCDRAFTQSGNLNNHIRLHTDEKPFKCHFCNKAFVQSGNLSSHIRNNHKYAVNTMKIKQEVVLGS